jgi:hypothetical protein
LVTQKEARKKREDEERSNASKYQENIPTHDNTIVTIGPDTNMFDTPIEECTPLESIPGSLSVTSAGLGFEGAVVIVGDYYYNHKMRSIEKITPKRKREKVDTSHETPERSIKWKAGPDPKDNAIQASFNT